MHTFQIDAPDTATENLFETSLYRFIEQSRASTDADFISLHTELCGAMRRKTVHLWSAEAVTQFEQFWRRFVHEQNAGRPSAGGAACEPGA
jgi:hypothetical protein